VFAFSFRIRAINICRRETRLLLDEAANVVFDDGASSRID